MKAHKEIIITLIEADLKHNQLLGNLRKMELHTDEYVIDLYQAIAELMGLGEEIHQQWFDIYDDFLLNAHQHPISSNSNCLRSQAKACYELLLASVKLKNHMNPTDVAEVAV